MPHSALYGIGPERAFLNVIHELDMDAKAAFGQLTLDRLPGPQGTTKTILMTP